MSIEEMTHRLIFEKTDASIKDPIYSTVGSAGFDIFMPPVEYITNYYQKIKQSDDSTYSQLNHLIKVSANVELVDGLAGIYAIVSASKTFVIPTGLKFDIPEGYALFAMNKSSIGSKGYIKGAELIDQDYTKEVMIVLHSLDNDTIPLNEQKIIQLVMLPVPKVLLHEGKVRVSTRGGFGSTGMH